ncbi:signal peptidase I [Microbacterium sp. NPDC057407]|uniref:signal peptidase I n=1 Tax=Microbacterium sp. NPDC057407 TaxID=3346120 RepID=UPI0036719879
MSRVADGLRRTGRVTREVLLTCAALGGLACIVLVVLAFTGGYSLILFKTGSMAPAIPAGSVALVQQVAATDVHVGDVVTVERPGALPITHRIRVIEEGPSDDERILILRGDANAVDDPLPYTVRDVRIVRGSVPYIAPAVALLGNPLVLGGITIGAAVLVSWAFWPRRIEGEEAPTRRQSAEASGAASRARGVVAVLLIVGSGVAPVFAPHATSAEASTGNYLAVRSDLEGAGVQQLDPAAPLYWHLDVDARRAPDDGELSISFSSTGDAEFGLRAEVRSCPTPWAVTGTCAADERVLFAEAAVAVDGTRQALWTSPTPDAVYLRISLTATPLPDAAPDVGASVTVRATAAGETVDTGVDGQPPLAETGGGSAALLAAPAALLLGLGIALVVRASSRRSIRP